MSVLRVWNDQTKSNPWMAQAMMKMVVQCNSSYLLKKSSRLRFINKIEVVNRNLLHSALRPSRPKPRSISSLARHTSSQVEIPALGVFQAVLTKLQVLCLRSTKTPSCDTDQAVITALWTIAGRLPPHRSTQAVSLDVLKFSVHDLRRIVGDHSPTHVVVRPGRNGRMIMKYLSPQSR